MVVVDIAELPHHFDVVVSHRHALQAGRTRRRGARLAAKRPSLDPPRPAGPAPLGVAQELRVQLCPDAGALAAQEARGQRHVPPVRGRHQARVAPRHQRQRRAERRGGGGGRQSRGGRRLPRHGHEAARACRRRVMASGAFLRRGGLGRDRDGVPWG